MVMEREMKEKQELRKQEFYHGTINAPTKQNQEQGINCDCNDGAPEDTDIYKASYVIAKVHTLRPELSGFL